METPILLCLIILFSPLVAFSIQIWVGWKLPRKGDWLMASGIAVSLVCALTLVFGWFFTNKLNPLEGGKPIDQNLVEFMDMGPTASSTLVRSGGPAAAHGTLAIWRRQGHERFSVEVDGLVGERSVEIFLTPATGGKAVSLGTTPVIASRAELRLARPTEGTCAHCRKPLSDTGALGKPTWSHVGRGPTCLQSAADKKAKKKPTKASPVRDASSLPLGADSVVELEGCGVEVRRPQTKSPDGKTVLSGGQTLLIGALPHVGEGTGNLLSFHIAFGVRIDNLTVLMLLVVTLVSFLVHLYSMGYMHGEVRYERFFAFLGLFSFSMLGLVISNSLFFTFVFWELVGVCSYFLIGFYFEKKSAAAACLKAFMTNRVGDTGFFIAMMIIFSTIGTTQYTEIFKSLEGGIWTDGMAASSLLIVAGMLLFMGPIGKSAQFPLHVWLPDAMEGPTPVSALIHAATMVAAGVYLLARMFPFFAGPGFYHDFGGQLDYLKGYGPLFWIALIGGFTAIFAATIALVQTDLKKVLAYSTVSQLGYMVLGVGTGSLVAGMFHLWTHAMFKALLFLGSGSVIHAVHSNEMSDMGGLRKKMPITFVTFTIGTLAIAGLPWLCAGFLSKDNVLAGAMAFWLHNGTFWHSLPFFMGMIAAVLTAFYMFRLLFLTFFGEPADQAKYDHAHESPWTMCVPLIVLATLSTGLGAGIDGAWFNNRLDPAALGYRKSAQDILGADHGHAAVAAPVQFAGPGAKSAGHAPTEGQPKGESEWVHTKHGVHWLMVGLSLVALIVGVGIAYLMYMKLRHKDLISGVKPLAAYRKVLQNLYYIDWFYLKFVIGTLMVVKSALYLFDKYVIDMVVNLVGWLTQSVAFVAGWIDFNGVDGAVRGTAAGVLSAGSSVRRVQTGKLQDYLYLTVVLLGFLFLIWMLAVALT